MKCEKCGGSLTLEDVVCPHCEALNEHAVEHIREMNRYKSEFEGTREEVYTVTKNFAGITTRIIVIAALVVLIIICGLISGESYSIHGNMAEAKARRNMTETKQTLDNFLADYEYYAFASFCNENRINGYEDGFEEYNSMIYATQKYCYIYDYVMGTLNPYEGMDMQKQATWIAEQLSGFYKVFETSDYHYVGDSGPDYDNALAMQEQIHALLMAYCNLTKEEAEALPDMTNAERTLLLEERIGNEE